MICRDCGQEKPLEEFPRHKRYPHGRFIYCKPCHNAHNRETAKRLHGGYRHYRLKQKYGIGASEVDAMITAQGGICPICEKRPAVHVDHDHKTGKVRAILCEPCNGLLGLFNDDPRIIQSAIGYLQRAEAKGGADA